MLSALFATMSPCHSRWQCRTLDLVFLWLVLLDSSALRRRNSKPIPAAICADLGLMSDYVRCQTSLVKVSIKAFRGASGAFSIFATFRLRSCSFSGMNQCKRSLWGASDFNGLRLNILEVGPTGYWTASILGRFEFLSCKQMLFHVKCGTIFLRESSALQRCIYIYIMYSWRN